VSQHAAAARATELEGLPLAFIGAGELDLFLDEDVDYTQRLIAAGVSTELHVCRRALHGFDRLAPGSRAGRRMAADMNETLRVAFDSK
jgi:acetyl esterase/lipase